MKYLQTFLHFWREFLFGDDWILTEAAAAGLFLVGSLARAYVNGWYVLPLAVVVGLVLSVRKARGESQ